MSSTRKIAIALAALWLVGIPMFVPQLILIVFGPVANGKTNGWQWYAVTHFRWVILLLMLSWAAAAVFIVLSLIKHSKPAK